jgi:hypothetical protein
MLPAAASGSSWRRGIVSLSVCSNLIAAFFICDGRRKNRAVASGLGAAFGGG